MPRLASLPATGRLLRALGLPLTLPLALSLSACRESADKQQVEVDLSALGADLDGDGFTAGVDCDDDNAQTYPGATEICDGEDNDCDGNIDEMGVVGTSYFYPDGDGDGYGQRTGRVRTCFAPSGYTAVRGDCDDTNTATYPGATEVCDGLDNDCDGVADEAGTVGLKSWFPDADADGQGDAAGTATRACFAPASTVNNKLDCDDTDPAVNTAATEVCDLKDNDCDGKIDEAGSVGVATYYADSDGDTYGNPAVRETACFPSTGFVSNRLDCNDSSAAISPAAAEVCDGVDNDCDAKIDEPGAIGELTFYRDADGDGYGKPALTVQRCSAPSGYVANATDCRDADPAVNPGAVELCDGIDNNCDLVTDDVDTDADGAIAAACGGPDCNDGDANVGPGQTELWYDGVDQDCDGGSDYDADLDGYDTLVSGGDDCDDADPARSPAAIEIWYDGIDQDCDGLSDYDADLDGQDSDLYAGTDCDDTRADVYDGAPEIWYDGVDQNCLGDSDFDADQDGFEVDVDCEDEVPTVNPLATEICGDGYDNDCSGDHGGCAPYTADLVTLAEATWTGESAGDRAGQGDPGFDRLGDWNGDGIDDFAVGALRDDDAGTDAGAVYIVFGGALSGTSTLASADLKITGEQGGDNFGRGVAGVGDVNGDGFADLLVGAIGVDENGADSGAGYLFYGPASGSLSASSSEATLLGEAAGEIAGEIAWVGDISGDGRDDIMVGAQYAGRGGTRRGAVYLFTSPPSGALTLNSANVIISGDADNDELGASCWGAGDMDGDGLNDLALAARADDEGGLDAGAVYVFSGGLSGSFFASDASAKLTGEGDGANIGNGVSVSTAGDLNADGYADLIIGNKNDDTAFTNAGGAYIVYGPLAGGTSSLGLFGDRLLGEAVNDYTGDSVGPAGDVDGDGYADVVIGSGYNDAGATNAGALYMVRGPIVGAVSLAAADMKRAGVGAEDRLRARGVGDVDGDGFDDIMAGAMNNDANGADSGAVYLFMGQGF